MFGKGLRAAVLGVLMFPSAAPALGLGDIRLSSALNVPLNAEIELIGATSEEISSLGVELASRETFARYGLERPAFMSSVSLKPARVGGRDVIQVRSAEAVTEPFVTLLIEVSWARGRLVREYTVLLDPPVFAPTQSAQAPVAAPAVGSGPRSGGIERAATAPAESPPPAVAGSSARAGVSAPGPGAERSYTVQRGETLFSIAGRLGGADNSRMMVGLYRANPRAFEGDMNSLRAGAILRVPAAEELAGIGAGEATSEVRRQYLAWRQHKPAPAGAATADPGRLRLVTPGIAAGSGAATPAAAAELQGLRDRVRALEGELSDSRRLVELRNAELADLQAKLAAAQQPRAPEPTGPPTSTPSEAPSAAAVSEAAPPETGAEAAPAAEPAAAAAPETSAVAAEEPAPARAAPRRSRATERASDSEGGGLLAMLKALWFVPVLALALFGGLFGYRKFRERQQVAFDDRLGALASAEPAAQAPAADGHIDTTRLRHPMPREEESFLVEESGTHERLALGSAPEGEPVVAGSVRADETLSSETAINLDQGDPLAEADFHMAYGLYDQAADLVRIAIAREPQRRDLRLKLLEVFFVWGNREQFLQTARELAETRAEAPAGEWEKIVIMGRQLAPDDTLFAHAGVSGAAAAGIDLNLEGGQNRIDFDLFGEPAAEQPAGRSGIDLDFSEDLAELGDRDPTGEAKTVETSAASGSELDFLLDDPAQGAEASGVTTRQMTSKLQPEPTVSLAEFNAEGSEAPTVEQPALHDEADATLRQKLEGVRRSGVAAEQTAELAIDDLGLDIGAMETVERAALPDTADAPTLIAGLDERSRQIMAEAEQRPAEAEPGPSASGTWLIDQSGLNSAIELPKPSDGSLTESLRGLGQDVHAAPADGSETSRLATLEVANDLDLDLGSLDATHPPGANGADLDLDVGSATALVEGPFEATQKVDADELALPDLEPVTMSEVGTKLDLARAYMDMGDPEGARSILEEVLQEGSQSQKQEAQRLVESLPG